MAEVFEFGLQQHKIKMDGKFFESNLFAVAGDTGRRLEVQLLDSNNMVQNTTGISLRLNANVAGQATYAEATLVDATKGLYELDLPNGMLIAPGNWQFQWQIIGTSGEKLHSFAFTGSVGSNLSEGGSEATNFYLNADELKQMQEDLVNGTFNSEVLETNIAEKLTDLETQYAPKLTEVAAQLADIAINVKSFGAKGDGVTDDTQSIQNSVDYAASIGGIVLFPLGTYNVSTIQPKQGIKGLKSDSATLVCINRTGEGVIGSTTSIKVSNYFIDGFTINCNDLALRGIFCNGNNITITNNVIQGLNSPTLSAAGIRFFEGSSDNVIENNKVFLAIEETFGTFTSLVGIHINGTNSSSYAGLDIGNDVVPSTNICTSNIIQKNYIEGGTHGIMLGSAENNDVVLNRLFKQSHRNIILSINASRNKVQNNRCLEFGSTAVHVAYGSSDNLISGNYCYSSGNFLINENGGEGAIQCYVHTKNNIISGNKIETNSTKFGIRVAINADGTTVINNHIKGGMVSAINVESDWITSVAEQKYYRPSGSTIINQSWTTWDNGKGLNNITLKGNTIERGTNSCGIYIDQTGTAIMSDLNIDGNTIISTNNTFDDFYLYVADSAKFKNITIKGNNVHKKVDGYPLVIFTNLDTKISKYEGNNWQSNFKTVSAATDTLDLSVYDKVHLATAMAITTVKGLNSADNSRIIIVRLSSGVVLTHNNSIVRLRGDANVNATSSNQMITFVAFSGLLLEVSRNF